MNTENSIGRYWVRNEWRRRALTGSRTHFRHVACFRVVHNSEILSKRDGMLKPKAIANCRSLIPPAALLLGLLAGCSPVRERPSEILTIGAFSVLREGFHDGIVPAFQEYWKAKTGHDVEVRESYNGSGALVRAIEAGLPADVAILSHSDDMNKLVNARLVRSDWSEGAGGGTVASSIVVIGVRPGNPKRLKDWADLANPGVGVLYPDPKTSGGARWNINAIFGSVLISRGSGPASERDVNEARKLVRRSKRTSSTWTYRVAKAWRIFSIAGSATRSFLMRTRSSSAKRRVNPSTMSCRRPRF